MDIEAYFERIGYKNSASKLDLDTLTKVLQHQMRTVPFENLNMHCGEAMDLGLEATFDLIVRKKRGGWCLQVNHLLYWALTKMGFETTMLGGYVYILPVSKYSREMVHLLVQVTISDRNYIVDAAYGGSYQMWEPLELASGKDQPQAPAIFRLTEEHGTWYLDQIRRQQYVPNQEFVNSDLLEQNEYRKIYSFTLEPRAIEDFEYVNTYLQTSPSSVFVDTSFCSLQTSDGVCCLIGSTIARRKFSYKDNVDLVEFKNVREEEIEDILKTTFGVSLEGKFVPKKAAYCMLDARTDARDGTMDIEAYFERIGYQNSRNKLDLQTLTEILQHQIRTIPFENLNIHCGESMELSLEAVFDQIVRKKRGGWCLQVNHLLYWALTKMGFETTMLGGYVFNTPANKYSSGMIHLLVQVTISDKSYIVDAGFGRSYQMWEPLELASGKDQPQAPAIFRLTEEHGTWYLDQIRRQQYVPNQEFVNSDLLEKNEYRKIYSFTLEPRTIEDFESMNTYLQTSPASVFTSKSFCSLQTPEGVYCLVGSTLTYRKFSYKDNVDLVEFKSLKEEEIENTLETIFGVSLERKLVPKHGDKFFTI